MEKNLLKATPESELRLELDKAQQEANMLRVKMTEWLRHEPTSKDYDRAMKAVEEIKKIAEEEPGFERFLYKIGKIGYNYSEKLLFLLIRFLNFATQASEKDKQRDRELHERFLRAFDDVFDQFKNLKEKSEQFSGEGSKK